MKLRRIINAIGLPLVVLVGGAIIMSILSEHNYVDQQLRETADSKDRKGLNMRFLGYDTDAVARHWGVLDDRALKSERRFLELDLIFPTLYGAALSLALWKTARTSFSPFWILLPVATIMISDWTENLIHLSQLHLFMERGANGLQPERIQIASVATTVKLLFFTGILLLTAWKSVQSNQIASVRGS